MPRTASSSRLPAQLGEDLLGFESDGAIESWLPIFLFVVLFGLSMDYHVFIVSRIRELWDRGMPTRMAVEQGITETAGVVTSAALVMIAVFGVFATLTGLDMKQLGVGLASAILIDATIVRAVLLPAAMSLLGDRNWYLPSKLAWLPRSATVRRRSGPDRPVTAKWHSPLSATWQSNTTTSRRPLHREGPQP